MLEKVCISFLGLFLLVASGCAASCPIALVGYDKAIRFENYFEEPVWIRVSYSQQGLEAYPLAGESKTALLSDTGRVRLGPGAVLIYGIKAGNGKDNEGLYFPEDFLLTVEIPGHEVRTYHRDGVLSQSFYDGQTYFYYSRASGLDGIPASLRLPPP